MTWTIRLPVEAMLSLNGREHWAAKARKTKLLRETAGWNARAASIPRCERLHVTLHYRPKVNRGRDLDNLLATQKPAVDGIRDAGCILDDTPDHLTFSQPVIHPPNETRTPALWLVVEDVSEPLRGVIDSIRENV